MSGGASIVPSAPESMFSSVNNKSMTIAQRESGYRSLANQSTGFIHSEILQFQSLYDMDRSDEAKAKRRSYGKWKYEGIKKDVHMFSTDSNFSKQPFLLGYTRMKCRSEYLNSYLLQPNSRFGFDNSLKENIELQRLTEKISLYYASFQTTNCILKYTINLCYLTAARSEGSANIIGYSSISPHPMMRAESGVSTIWLHFSGFWIEPFICEDGSTESLVYYLYQVDFQKDLPVKILRFAQDRMMMQLAYIRMIVERCLLSGSFGGSKNLLPEMSIPQGESFTDDALSSIMTKSFSRQNSTISRNSDKGVIKVPSCGSLASLGSGHKVMHRSSSIIRSSSSPPMQISRQISDSPSLEVRDMSRSLSMRSSRSSRDSSVGDRDPDSSAILNNLFFYDCSDDEVDHDEDETEKFEEAELMQSLMSMVDPETERATYNRGISESSDPGGLSSSRTSSILGYGNMAVAAAGSLFKEYVEIVESVRFAQLHPEKFIWKVIEQKKGVWCMEKTSSCTMSICGVTRVDTDEVTLLNYLREPQNRVQYDKLSNKTYVVEEINDDLMIVYTHLKTQYCFIGHDRDLCNFTYTTKQDKKTILAMASCSHPACPKEKGITRAKMYDSGFIIEPLPDEPAKCSLVYVLKIDAGGYLPHSLLWLVKRRQPLILARIARHFDRINKGHTDGDTLT